MEDVPIEHVPSGLVGRRAGSVYFGNGTGAAELRALAIDVIEEYLGPVVSAVAQILLRYGQLTLRQVLDFGRKFSANAPSSSASNLNETSGAVFDKLTLPMVRSALVVLIRHGIVQLDAKSTEIIVDGKPKAKHAFYSICPRRALMLMRHSKIIECVRRTVGSKAAVLVEELLLVGSDSRRKVIRNVAYRVTKNLDESGVAQEAFADTLSNHPKLRDLQPPWEEELISDTEPFDQVLERPVARIVIQACQSEWDTLEDKRVILRKPTFSVKTVDEEKERELKSTSASRKRADASTGGKRKLSPGASKAIEPSSKRSAPTPPQKSNAGCPELTALLGMSSAATEPVTNITIEPAATPGAQPQLTPEVAAKPTVNQASEDREYPPGDPRGDFWFTINWNYFLQFFRSELICEYWADKCQLEVVKPILRVLCETNINHDVSTKSYSDPFELPSSSGRAVNARTIFDEARQEVVKAAEGHNVDRIDKFFEQVVNVIVRLSDGVIRSSETGHTGMVDLDIDFDAAIRRIKRRCMLQQVKAEHGLEGLRIVNLLLEKQALEEKQVGDMAMLPPKLARTRLYKLLADGYLILEEAPKKADMHPSFTLFLFRVNEEMMERVVAASALKALLNLRIRHRSCKDDQAKYEEVREEVQKFEQGAITALELKKVQGVRPYLKLSHYVELLDKAILDVDTTVLLLTGILEQEQVEEV